MSIIGPLGLDVTGPNLAYVNNTLYSVDRDPINNHASLLQINTSSGVATYLSQLSINGINTFTVESVAERNGKLVVAFSRSVSYSSTILGNLSLTGEITDARDVGVDMDALTNNNLGQLYAIDSEPGTDQNNLYNVTSGKFIGSNSRDGGGNSIDDLAFIGTELYAIAKTKLLKINASTGEILKITPLNKSGAYNGLAVKKVKTCKAVNDTVQTEKNTIITSLNVLLNDTDTTGATLFVSNADTKSEKGATITNNNNGTFIYTPIIGFVGNDTFTYYLSNNKGCTDSGKVIISVNETASSGGGSFDIIGLFAFFFLLIGIVRKRQSYKN